MSEQTIQSRDIKVADVYPSIWRDSMLRNLSSDESRVSGAERIVGRAK